jgi:hypothetical protein
MLEWRLIWADENGDFFTQDKRGGRFGDSRGRANLASLFSGSIWQVYSAGFLEKEKQSNRKEK